MLKVFHKSGCEMKSSLAAGVYHLEFFFGKGKQRAEETPDRVKMVGA